MVRDVSFLLLSGGTGTRSGHYEPKQFRIINQLEMMAYSLIVANKHPRVAEIITNAPEGYLERTRVLCQTYAPDKTVKIVSCGRTRQESVRLLASEAAGRTVILHEAARPMIDRKMIDELLTCSADNAGLFAAIPFSMCEVDLHTGEVMSNVPRSKVFNIQLPQKFCLATLRKAHDAALKADIEFTEDAVMVHQMTQTPVKAIAGHVKNIKVTTPEDFGIVAKLMEEEKNA